MVAVLVACSNAAEVVKQFLLEFLTQPSATPSGRKFLQQPSLQLRDIDKNAVEQAGVPITAAIASGGGTLTGNPVATTNALGIASFTDLAIAGVPGPRTLSFSAPEAPLALLSDPVQIRGLVLALTTQPAATTTSGVVLSRQPVVQLRDDAGGTISETGVVVTVALNGGGTLGGTNTATTNASGVATFVGLSITGTVGTRNLTFSAPSYPDLTSANVAVTGLTLSITTQPGATTTSGAALAPQPVLQVRDGTGAAVSQLGVVVTASIATGGGTLGGTVTANTNASGVATFTNLSITGTAGSRTLTFDAPGLGSATSTSITIPGSSSDPEPVFNAATQVKLLQDEFDVYTTFASVTAAGWKGLNGGITQDVSTGPAGANQIAPSGYDGTGKALRLVYDGVSNGSGQEAHSWSHPIGDVLAGAPGHAFYMSYYIRITPGGGIELDQDANHNIQVKWLELWNNTDGDRAQFNTGYSTCTNGLPTTLFQFYGNSGGNTICNAGQVRPPFFYQGTRAWHRITHKYMTQSATGARDGIAQVWMDGVLILSIAPGYCGVVVPNYVGSKPGGPPVWCNSGDQDAMYVKNYALRFTLGSVHTGGLWPFTLDWDHMILWRD